MIKTQYKDTNKKLNISTIKTFTQFTEKVKKTIKNLPEDCTFYYFDQDNDQIEIQNDEDFEAYKSQEKLFKIYIKSQDEDFLDVNNISRNNIPNQILTKEILNQPIQQAKQQNSGIFKKDKNIQIKQIQKEQKVQRVQKVQILNRTVHKNIHCTHCKAEVIGIRWKCLDQFDTDVCNRCYQAKTHKVGHNLLSIQTQDYLLKVNYYDTIHRLFNPNYQAEKSANNLKVKEWIKEQDILQSKPQAVKVIWEASKSIAQKVANEYGDWEKEWQRLNKREQIKK